MAENTYTSVEVQIEYGLDTIPQDATVTMPLRDFMYAFQTFGELVRFFHRPLHWQSLDNVSRFMGNADRGALRDLGKLLSPFERRHSPRDRSVIRYRPVR
jgi:hypothetical protein